MLTELKQTKALKTKVENLLSRVSAEQIKKKAWETERTRLLLGVEEKRKLTGTLLKVVELFKELGGSDEQQVLKEVEDFVSYGISTVFGSDYKFVTSMGTEGKDLRVEFEVYTRDLRTSVIGAKGGGLAEVISILFQIFFVLVDKELSRLIVLDAALIQLSEKYWKNMSQLLAEICNTTDIQILLLAHAGDYGEYADMLYEFTQTGGKTKARRLK